MSLRTIESLRRVELSTTLVIPKLETLGAVAAQRYSSSRKVPVGIGIKPLDLSPINLGSHAREILHEYEMAELELAFIADALFYANPLRDTGRPPETRWVPEAIGLLSRHTNDGFERTSQFTDQCAPSHVNIYKKLKKTVEPPMPHGPRGVIYARQVADGHRKLRQAPQVVLN